MDTSSSVNLLQSRKYLLSVLLSATDAIVTIDRGGRICFWNRAAARLFGYEQGEIIERPVTLLMPEIHRARHTESMARFVETRKGKSLGKVLELTGRRKDGSEFPLELTLGQWRGHEGLFVTGIIRDITERRARDEALREKEEQFRIFFDGSQELISIWDEKGGIIIWANPAWRKALGYDLGRLDNPREKIHPDDREMVLSAWKDRKDNGTPIEFPQYRFRKADGEYAILGTKASKHEAGGRKLWYFISRDISELVRLRREHLRSGIGGIVGRDRKMTEIFESIMELAHVDVPVLILGESGTGKELVARAVHDQGRRAKHNFIAVNCSAIPAGLLEGELFGHVKGAFTGAHRNKKGRFELADGGTIFLDEIGDLPLPLQVKLLRVLQEGTFERVGSEKQTRVNVRLISATNKDLKKEVARRRFREDLFYRVDVFPLSLPPLRDRPGDIILIANHILEKEAHKYEGRKRPLRESSHVHLHPSVIPMLLNHGWPGNVRELQNVLRFALVKCKGEAILPKHLPPVMTRPSTSPAGRKVKRGALTRGTVTEALEKAGGNKLKAARALGVSRATLYRFLEKQR